MNVLILSVNCVTKCNGENCYQGICKNNHCECLPGWVGDKCDRCYGRGRLNGTHGYIFDGLGNYSADTKCSWLLETGTPNTTVRFKLKNFATECGWDHVYIHDGDSALSPLIAAYSGLLLPKDHNGSELEFLASVHKPYIFIHFYSDAAYIMSGFNVSYRVGDCLYGCSGHGSCMGGQCQCQAGWTGEGCQDAICPHNCSFNGSCVGGSCKCEQGWRGDDCSLTDGESVWEIVSATTLPKGRASHSAVMVEDTMYIVGGYALAGTVYKPLFRYNFTESLWESEPDSSEFEPRYSHTTVYHQGKLYVYGGVVNGQIRSDLLAYDINKQTWELLTPSSHNVSGHTAHIIDGVMLVIFGYSPVYGYTNIVQEYDISNDSWSIANVTGAIIQGGYGHTSVYDADTDLILVYAGYHSESQSGHNLTDKLYSYDPFSKTWTILRSSGYPRSLHSASIIDGMMLVFGGNTHNGTSVSQGAKCYSLDFMAYNIRCNSWHRLKAPNLNADISRYGQSMVTFDRNFYIFGGFNGLMLNDLLKYTPGDCTYYKDKQSCLAAVPGVMCVWNSTACVTEDPTKPDFAVCNATKGAVTQCPLITSCQNCVNNAFGCEWCGRCSHKCENETGNTTVEECTPDDSVICRNIHNCPPCQAAKCFWNAEGGKVCTPVEGTHRKIPCAKSCSSYKSCENCTDHLCMWCSNMKQCVETNSYVVSFPYGQCMEWTTKKAKCPATRCSGLHSCKECQAHPMCGWCNDPSNTGLGKCVEGGAIGPLSTNGTEHHLNYSICPKSRWHFVDCPLCQCNGHATCKNGTAICEECRDLTEGDRCQYCREGYYGDPRNGKNCTACECNGQADKCNRHSGVCHCRTRGVIGDRCERCDDKHKYLGNPKEGGICYYPLLTDYQFTFNLSKPDDRNYTQINFMNIPSSGDHDVDFTLNCSRPALLNITYRSKSYPEEQTIIRESECNYFHTKFDHKKYVFGGEENTTFLVYVYGFDTPFWLQIAFSQFPKIDLVHFFVTFFSCFLSLLLIAAALWKIKHRYDSYRRRQQMIQEMQQMASRPFASISMEIDRKFDNCSAEKKEQQKDQQDTVTRKRKKIHDKPSAVALEPLTGQKAAILSLIIQLPTGGMNYAPSGQSGLAVGSALVTVGNTRKQSLEHIKGDKSKIRKNLYHTHPDVCA